MDIYTLNTTGRDEPGNKPETSFLGLINEPLNIAICASLEVTLAVVSVRDRIMQAPVHIE